jgi:hypothetical protein
MAKSSRKKWFAQLYCISSHTQDSYLLKLVVPITYQQYFTLVKLIHHAFIYWQLQHSLQDSNLDAISSIHILLDRPVNYLIIGETTLDFFLLKKFLTEFRRLASLNQRIVNLQQDISSCINYLDFIERLVDYNSNYKSSSLRQIKSIYIKKITSRRVSEERYTTKARFLFNTDRDLVDIFFILFKETCQPIRYLDSPPCPLMETQTRTNCSLNLDLATLTETVLDIDLENEQVQ